MEPIKPGTLLLSDPFLQDENFIRTVIIICENDKDGSFGLVVNKPFDYQLGEIIPELSDVGFFPVYQGGPVKLNTLHFLHKRPDIIKKSIPLTNGIYWGGNFDELIQALQLKKIASNELRFFVGYSGWSENQLEDELADKSWITHTANAAHIFETDLKNMWGNILKEKGGEYAYMANYPLDPQFN
jgi:putative transcriptional regulator